MSQLLHILWLLLIQRPQNDIPVIRCHHKPLLINHRHAIHAALWEPLDGRLLGGGLLRLGDLVDQLSFVDDFPDAGGAVAGTDADAAFRGEGLRG
jgi:hypothetical protein